MRYESWDVLTFPAGNSRAPLPEYSTKCAAIRDNALRAAVADESGITPLLTCFIPALRADEPFQISVHNWLAQPAFEYACAIDHDSSEQVWQVRVDIDGIQTAVERYPFGTSWPQNISRTNLKLSEPSPQGSMPLRFPPFYHSATQTHVWDAADEQGRILIEISEGFVDTVDGNESFTKLKNHVLFNFQPAPLGSDSSQMPDRGDVDSFTEVLQRVGIAWPNPAMFEKALPAREFAQQRHSLADIMSRVIDAKDSNNVNKMVHQRNLSGDSVASSYFSFPVFSTSIGVPGPPPPTPAMSMTYGISPGSICHDSSRSTSAYSNIPYSSLPLCDDQLGQLDRDHSKTSQVKAMLSNVNVLNDNCTLFSTNQESMPPPPLPQRAPDAKFSGTTERRAFSSPDLRTAPQKPQGMQSFGDRRKESRSNESDVSMHVGCMLYPDCTSEDSEGHIVHTPSAVVQGRKEGKENGNGGDRDYMSVILSPLVEETNEIPAAPANGKESSELLPSSPADGAGRKRTRAATRALLNIESKGSPEKTSKPVETSQPARKVSKVSITLFSKEHP